MESKRLVLVPRDASDMVRGELHGLPYITASRICANIAALFDCFDELLNITPLFFSELNSPLTHCLSHVIVIPWSRVDSEKCAGL